MTELFSAAVEGRFDDAFAVPPPEDRVHISGPVDLLTLTIMFHLFGLTSELFYKGDAERFVRTSLMTQRLLGMPKLYVSWPVYGLTAEAIGQEMIYSDRYSPGTNPDRLLLDRDNWDTFQTPDMKSGIPKLLDEVCASWHRLTGLQPVLHLSAPYSIAADTLGQEAIINELTYDRDFVNRLLDRLADVVLEPWIDHFFAQYPDGWVELSDASGSPFFIGPDNCRDVAIRASRRLKAKNPWGDRVYDANYRGDYVTAAGKSSVEERRRRAKPTGGASKMTLDELFEAKYSVCPDYVIRLADDRMPVSFYEEQAIRENIPLFLGIGATQIDRNSIVDIDAGRAEAERYTIEYTGAIKRVASTVAGDGYPHRRPPWPGCIYFEDISAESSFELIEVIIDTGLAHGSLV